MNWDYSSPARNNLGQNVLSLDSWRQQSHAMSPWKSRVSNRLLNLGEGDEYTEQSNITTSSLLNAKNFLDFLPLDIDAPHVSANADGSILFEWYKKELNKEPTIFSAIVKNEAILFAVLQQGTPTTHGALNFSNESLDIITAAIRKHFGILHYASRSVS